MLKIKTVKDLSLEEVAQYRQSYKEREKQKKLKLGERYKEAWETARRVAEILYGRYRAKKVAIFGSLRSSELFNEWSDIDIAVWGIEPELYYKAVAETISLSPIFKIDIVDPDDCSESLKRLIEKEGIIII